VIANSRASLALVIHEGIVSFLISTDDQRSDEDRGSAAAGGQDPPADADRCAKHGPGLLFSAAVPAGREVLTRGCSDSFRSCYLLAAVENGGDLSSSMLSGVFCAVPVGTVIAVHGLDVS